jgi:hypothetical protein
MTARKIAFLVLLAWSTAMAQQSSRSERYSLKRDIDFSSIYLRATGAEVFGGIPFDKPYRELTADQQNRFKLFYVALGESDEPPFPLHGLGALYRPVAKGQQRFLVSGEFRADAEIDEDGNVSAVAVLQSPSEQVTKFMANVLLLTKFKPALCGGQPCSMGFPVKVTFKVE